MSPYRGKLCFCIPFRFAVCIFSILALGLAGCSIWSVFRVKIEDQVPRIVYIVAACVYSILGVSGLVAVLFKRYALAKNFSVLWWTVTLIVTALSIAGTVLLATREKDQVMNLCATELVGTYYGPGSGGDVDDCYKYVMTILGSITAVQTVIMLIGGMVASRYTREVSQRMDAFVPPPMAYSKPEPLLQPAHPYTHIGKHN
ncbi:hypothetical protein B0O80DRAFT_457353 [Mortierella sp. GBAus27b]|nr:hypothetical protein BGX31_002630 [Mortierella sp. GBA43]KAI8350738.1 hypothetical protein B0O80DRAFT_457353 [Mortierella sp. GBAus27b]